MKYLINQNFKAIRKGAYVTSNEDAGEFIFDTDDAVISVAAMLEIATANKLKVSKDKKEAVVLSLTEELESLEISIMSEKTDTQKVGEIVAAGIESGSSDDEMLIQIVQSGIKFKAAGKLFAQAMQEGGYRITNKARKEECRKILVEEEFNPETYSELEEMLEKLTKEVNDTETSQAFSCVKAYAREFEISLPKAPAKPKGGMKVRAQNWMIENPDATNEDLAVFIEETLKKDDPNGKILAGLSNLLAFGQAMRKA